MKLSMVVLLLLAAIALFGSHDALAQFVWTKDPLSPVLSGGSSGAWNQNVFNPCVLYNADSARYEMWFGATADITAGTYSIGFASSKDRVTWSIHPTPVLSPDPGAWDEGSLLVRWQHANPLSILPEGGAVLSPILAPECFHLDSYCYCVLNFDRICLQMIICGQSKARATSSSLVS